MTTGTEFPGLTATQVNALIALYVDANAAPADHTHTVADITDIATTYASANTAFVYALIFG